MPIRPHGGKLIDRVAKGDERQKLLKEAENLHKVPITVRDRFDLEMIAIGGFSPLEGYIGEDDYHSVIDRMRLSNGLPFSVPITLSATQKDADKIDGGGRIALVSEDGEICALMEVREKYRYDKKDRAQKVFKTTDEAHPGVAATYRMKEVLLGGPITLLNRMKHDKFNEYRKDPAETRKMFEELGWKTVVAFQTRNPVHRAHEYLQKCAMEMVDGLLLHPIVGETREEDIPVDVRMQCYIDLLSGYYPKDRARLVVLPTSMRYAGPKEAIFHSIMRKNFGCTHFIVGRDHAGVGSYYGTYDAHCIFDEFEPGELEIQPIFFDHAFYCRKCGNMASTKTCCHDKSEHVFFSGTKVREMLREGKCPPPEFTRPEVAEILLDAVKTGKWG
jgi:sulfate adenylyltransferase